MRRRGPVESASRGNRFANGDDRGRREPDSHGIAASFPNPFLPSQDDPVPVLVLRCDIVCERRLGQLLQKPVFGAAGAKLTYLRGWRSSRWHPGPLAFLDDFSLCHGGDVANE